MKLLPVVVLVGAIAFGSHVSAHDKPVGVFTPRYTADAMPKEIGRENATLASAALPVSGQTSERPAFEVVSVRVVAQERTGADAQPTLNGSTTLWSPAFRPSGQLTIRNVTMRQLIALAYKEVLATDYLTGGPGWIEDDRFDVQAKVPENTPLHTQRLMLQAALEDRFSLQVHREQRSMPVFALVVAKGGPKLRPTTVTSGELGGCPRSQVSPDGLVHKPCENTSMSVLAEQLPIMVPTYVNRPVIDQTGISGAFDFRLDWAPPYGVNGLAPPKGPTLFQALEKDLGLQLEERRLPMSIIVIDRLNRKPTEN